MAAPLPRWSDTLLRAAIGVVVLVIVGVPSLLIAWVRSPMQRDMHEAIDQPVLFDHRHHVRDDGIDCLYCHYDAERAPRAGVPETAVCMGCHAQIWNESPLLEPVRESWEENVPLRWNRVHKLPDFAYFDHSIHVTRGVGCETCHGRVDLMARVEKTEPMNMRWCLECHQNPAPHLRPVERVTEMGYLPDPGLGRRIAEQFDIDPGTHCTTCHR